VEIIYGEDDRTEVCDLLPGPRFDNAACVMLWTDSHYIRMQGPNSALVTAVYGQQWNLCRSERFWTQDKVENEAGTAYFVAPDMIATAAHNLISERTHQPIPVADLRLITGFRLAKDGMEPLVFGPDHVYRGVRIVWYDKDQDGALVQLDRPVVHGTVCRTRIAERVQPETRVYAIGHPMGLPMKYAGNAKVFPPDDPWYFRANLDIYPGNSGSPVFNADTGMVEGLVFEAPESFRPATSGADCNVSVEVKWDEKPFVKVLYSSTFAPLVPGYTMAVSGLSKLPIGVRDGSMADGVPIVQQDFTMANSQWLRLERQPNGYYRIVVNHSGKVFHVVDDPRVSGSAVVQHTWTGQPSQLFTLQDVDLTFTQISPALNSDLVLNVKGGSMEPGAEIIVYKNTLDLNEAWIKGSPIVSMADYKVADIRGGSMSAGADVIVYEYGGGFNQIFNIEWVRDDRYRIVSRDGTRMVFTSGTAASGGSRVRMYPWQDMPRQLFRLLPAGDGTCRIKTNLGMMLQPEDGFIVDRPETRETQQKWGLQVT
jgi:hypothetical protein